MYFNSVFKFLMTSFDLDVFYFDYFYFLNKPNCFKNHAENASPGSESSSLDVPVSHHFLSSLGLSSSSFTF